MSRYIDAEALERVISNEGIEISKNIRAYINSHPEADEFWETVARHITVAK